MSEVEKGHCMSKTNCSLPNLVRTGELIHHFGIFHGMVDRMFKEFALAWFLHAYPDYYTGKKCPYDDISCKDDQGLMNHLTVDHYYNLILAEVENMVLFKLTYVEEKRLQFNVFKCPYCTMRFSNSTEDPDPKDLRLLINHCGASHGFALYYLVADKHIADYRRLLVKQEIKEEINATDEKESNAVEPAVDHNEGQFEQTYNNGEQCDDSYVEPPEEDFIHIQEEPIPESDPASIIDSNELFSDYSRTSEDHLNKKISKYGDREDVANDCGFKKIKLQPKVT